MNENPNNAKGDGNDHLVRRAMLSKVLKEQENTEHLYDPIGDEPVIEKSFHDELLKICGRMGLAGAPPPVVRGVHSDIRRVVQVLVGTIRMAHRAL